MWMFFLFIHLCLCYFRYYIIYEWVYTSRWVWECLCLCHKCIMRVRNCSDAPRQTDGTRTTAPAAAPKCTNDLRPHIPVTSAHPSQQKGGRPHMGWQPQRTRGSGQSILLEANHPGKSWEHGPRHPGPPDTQPNWATKGAGQRPRLEHSATFPRKQNKMLLYEDFMADFVCLHFCTRRCRKDGKLVGTKVKPCFQGLLTAGPTDRMLSITTFTVPLDQTKSFMFKNFYFTQTLNIKNIIVMATL